MIVQSSFPEYIVVTLGTGFPLAGGGNTGYLGLFENDLVILKRVVLSATQVSYTESGSLTPSLLIPAPGPIASPQNRIRLNMKMSFTGFSPTTTLQVFQQNNMSGIGAGVPNAWVDLSSAVTVAYLAGWSNISSWSAWGASIATTAFPYNFMDVATWLEPVTIKNMEAYLPDLQVTCGTGGTITVSELNPDFYEEVTVTAAPDYGYSFSNWSSGSGGSVVTLASSYTFDMPFGTTDGVYELHANFVPITDFRINGLEPSYV